MNTTNQEENEKDTIQENEAETTTVNSENSEETESVK